MEPLTIITILGQSGLKSNGNKPNSRTGTSSVDTVYCLRALFFFPFYFIEKSYTSAVDAASFFFAPPTGLLDEV